MIHVTPCRASHNITSTHVRAALHEPSQLFIVRVHMHIFFVASSPCWIEIPHISNSHYIMTGLGHGVTGETILADISIPFSSHDTVQTWRGLV